MHKAIVAMMLLFFSLGAQTNDMDQSFKGLLSNTSIVATKRIKIPGYPNAYNPSLIPYKEGYLLSFRFIGRFPETVKKSPRTNFSFIGVAMLDKKFNVQEETVQLLNIVSYSPQFSLTAEDGRLLKVGNQIFVFFNDLSLLQTKGQFAMYFGELIEEKGIFVLKEPAKLLNYPNAGSVEKNWSPFWLDGNLYLIYSDQPRIILEVDLHTGYCREVTRTDPNWNWRLGRIRGGTPAYLVKEQFLTFFHSSFPAKTSKGRAYVMGAYTFDKDPPFAVRSMTSAPLGNLADYTEENPSKVVFPAGMVVEERHIFVAWGKADKQIYITTFDREKLLASMHPCSE